MLLEALEGQSHDLDPHVAQVKVSELGFLQCLFLEDHGGVLFVEDLLHMHSIGIIHDELAHLFFLLFIVT